MFVYLYIQCELSFITKADFASCSIDQLTNVKMLEVVQGHFLFSLSFHLLTTHSNENSNKRNYEFLDDIEFEKLYCQNYARIAFLKKANKMWHSEMFTQVSEDPLHVRSLIMS